MGRFDWYHDGIRAYWRSLSHRGRANFIWRETIAKRSVPIAVLIALLDTWRDPVGGGGNEWQTFLVGLVFGIAVVAGLGYWWADRVWNKFSGASDRKTCS